MCDNCKNCKGNGNTIALAFKENESAIGRVFVKYGMGHMAVNGNNALIGVTALGQPFLEEMSMAAAGMGISNVTGTDAEKANLAASILSIFGTAVGAGVDIAKGVSSIKNQQNGNTQPNNQGGQPQVIVLNQPSSSTDKAAEKKYFGFTGTQLGLLIGAVVLIGVTIFILNREK